MYLVTVLLIKAMQMKQQGETLSRLLDGLREPWKALKSACPF